MGLLGCCPLLPFLPLPEPPGDVLNLLASLSPADLPLTLIVVVAACLHPSPLTNASMAAFSAQSLISLPAQQLGQPLSGHSKLLPHV